MKETDRIPVLLVDDRPENLIALEGLLEDLELQIFKAQSGNEALSISLKHDLAIVLMDVRMPDMDGFETAELMRSNQKTRNLPIIFVTAALKDANYQFKGYEAGAVDYLLKPIEPTIMRSKVRIFCDLYSQRHHIELREQDLELLIRERTAALRAANEHLLLELTERKVVEEALRESEMRYKMLLSSVTDYIYTVQVQDNRPVSTVHGPGCAAVTGYDPEDYTTDPGLWYRMVYEPDREEVLNQAASILAGNAAQPLDHRILHRDGSMRWVRNTPVPRYDQQQHLIAYDGLIEDITERRVAEESLHNLTEELEQRVKERTSELEESGQALMDLVEDLNRKTEELKMANVALTTEISQRQQAQEEISLLNKDLQRQKKALEDTNHELETFSYSVSHDLRAPLRHIDGFSQALQEEYSQNLPATGQEYLELIRKSCHHMQHLIDDLLTLSRLIRAPINREQICLSDLAHQIMAEFHQAEPGRQVETSIAEGLTVSGDTTLLQAVMENLLGNAWKYTGKKEIALIEFGTKEQNGRQVYFVKDNGAGFDMAYANKLFGVFQRLHSDQEFEGTGVGLATTQRIIHRHGGEIWAEAEKDKGATFYFCL